LLACHGIAFLAPWTVTEAGVTTAVTLFLLIGLFGLGLGYHRLLCHRSFSTTPWLRYPLTFLGLLAFQKGPLTWCAIHRLHHRHADTDQDPQMSGRGFLWTHMFWAIADLKCGLLPGQSLAVVGDLRREPMLRWMEQFFYPANALFALGLFLSGYLVEGLSLGISLLVWSFFVRVVFVWHLTFLVNSVSHRRGYRNYASRDNSRNCWWVALLTFGEGWHNNHHHRPRCAAHGHRWFEIDVTYSVIRLLEKCGLAQAVVRLPGQGASGPASSQEGLSAHRQAHDFGVQAAVICSRRRMRPHKACLVNMGRRRKERPAGIGHRHYANTPRDQ
jgi:stearoyl-CoA desaturase (delta-9 desaturase)